MAGHITKRHEPNCAKRRDKQKRCNCDGPWRVRIPDPSRPGTAQIERRFPTGAKREAEAWKTAQEHALQNDDWIDPRRAARPFREVADAWRSTWVDLEPKTKHGYEALLEKHLLSEFGSRKASSITHEVVQAYINRLSADGLAAATVRNVYAALRASLNAGVRLRMIARNPCVGVKLPRPNRQPMLFLTAEEVAALADAIDPYYRTLIYLAAYTGLRAGELLALRRLDVDLLRGTLHVRRALKDLNGALSFGPTKTHAERTVSLPKFLRSMLEDHLSSLPSGSGSEALVFPGPEGGPMRHGNFYRRHFRPTVLGDPENGVSPALPERLAGLRFHDLRHTCASLLIAEGAHPKLIQERLGHSSITITLDRYGHLFPRLEEALVEKLDAAFESTTSSVSSVAALAEQAR